MLGAAGYTPEQIDVVVLTHFHPDHIGGNLEDGKPAFANARYVSSAAEYDFWSPIDKASGPTERVGTLVQTHVVPFRDRFTFVADDVGVAPGLTATNADGTPPGIKG